jgi:hypothetical protein
MAEAYVRMAGEIDRMNDLAFFAKYGEASLAARFLSENADEAGRRIFELCKRHARSVCEAFETVGQRYMSELRAGDLPVSSLLVAVISRHESPADPLFDLTPQSFEVAARSQELRIAFDHASRSVLLEGRPSLTGSKYALLNALRADYERAQRAQRAPERYPFMKAEKLSELLGIEEPTLRKRVSRLRNELVRQSEISGTPFLGRDALIENKGWEGYRLNPFVRVVAPADLKG